jgi:hypothetical protein
MYVFWSYGKMVALSMYPFVMLLATATFQVLDHVATFVYSASMVGRGSFVKFVALMAAFEASEIAPGYKGGKNMELRP